MENKKEYKYQWSSKADNGEIILVRSDNKEELILDIEWAKSQSRVEKPVESHPERAEGGYSIEPKIPYKDYSPTIKDDPEWFDVDLNEKHAGKTIDELPGEDICLVHNAKMFGKEGRYGKFYTHGEKQADGTWKNCNGKGWK